MVYRGKPSAGCENCRKAKKRCGLELPACTRCVKLRKVCAGYRDTTQLQIQDESEAVRRKANRTRRRSPPSTKPNAAPESGHTSTTLPNNQLPGEQSFKAEIKAETPSLALTTQAIPTQALQRTRAPSAAGPSSWLRPPAPVPSGVDELAVNYFFDQFTASSGHWTFLRDADMTIMKDPLLDVSMRACGMAALHNVRGVVMGREYARSVYGQAIGLLNTALRDPKMCRLDSTLISVAMLGYYENLVCDSMDSVRSWKAHISGATQLLHLRGKAQFKSSVGRMLYREIRTQVLISCIWDQQEPPAFILEWETELQKQSSLSGQAIAPPDRLAVISFDFATLLFQIRSQTISNETALHEAADIQMRMIQWSMSTMSYGEAWRFNDLAVPESPHVWNGTVHAYNSLPAAGVWNTYRILRIMLTRTQEDLCKMNGMGGEALRMRVTNFRAVRRQMTDEICGGIPSQLGHAAPGLNSQCVLITAYASIWPLFFASVCALERVGYDAWDGCLQVDQTHAPDDNNSMGAAQVAWLIGRIGYIGNHVGLRWANGFAQVLRGDAKVNSRMLNRDNRRLEKLVLRPTTAADHSAEPSSASSHNLIAHPSIEDGNSEFP